MIFLNINMAGWGRYHECINMLASRDCLSPSRQIILCQNATGNLSFLRPTNWPPKLHPINFCPKFGRSPIQWKIFDSERKTLPDWYKFSRWFLALSRFSPFTFSLISVTINKKNVNKFPTFHHLFFLFFTPGKSCSSEDLIQVPLPSSKWIRNVSNF